MGPCSIVEYISNSARVYAKTLGNMLDVFPLSSSLKNQRDVCGLKLRYQKSRRKTFPMLRRVAPIFLLRAWTNMHAIHTTPVMTVVQAKLLFWQWLIIQQFPSDTMCKFGCMFRN